MRAIARAAGRVGITPADRWTFHGRLSDPPVGRDVAEKILGAPPADRPDAVIVTTDYLAAGLCERLRAAEDYRPAIAVMANKQLPLSYALPVLSYESDLEHLAAATVRMAKDRLLSPSADGPVETIPPVLRAETATVHTQ